MTPAEALHKEQEEIIQRTGRYIPPYRMASLTKTAQKVTDLLIKFDACTTYDESLFVLRIISGAIKDVMGYTNDHE